MEILVSNFWSHFSSSVCVCVCVCVVCVCAQSCPTHCNPMNCSLPGSSVQGISQARILEWLPFPSPGDLPDPGIKPASPELAGRFFTTGAAWEALFQQNLY